MSPRKIEIAPELVAEGKRLYEQTLTPLRDVAAMMGICRRTLENRIREWNWTRRRTAERPIDLRHAMRGAVIAAATRGSAGNGATLSPLSPEQQMAIALSIHDAVAQNIAAVRRLLEKIEPLNSDETERSARTLAMTAQTLRELAAFVQHDPVTPSDETDDDPVPRDIDEFRRELVRRIRGFIDARRSGGDRVSADAEGDMA